MRGVQAVSSPASGPLFSYAQTWTKVYRYSDKSFCIVSFYSVRVEVRRHARFCYIARQTLALPPRTRQRPTLATQDSRIRARCVVNQNIPTDTKKMS